MVSPGPAKKLAAAMERMLIYTKTPKHPIMKTYAVQQGAHLTKERAGVGWHQGGTRLTGLTFTVKLPKHKEAQEGRSRANPYRLDPLVMRKQLQEMEMASLYKHLRLDK
ncbi:hypothetical protein CB1_000557011 [Camelus ferus]|nr:hypothetical protein CB1_001858009 [Camelus ferus]EPY83516.1 hypothetical protein CB1_000557011 [Camelus ferus]